MTGTPSSNARTMVSSPQPRQLPPTPDSKLYRHAFKHAGFGIVIFDVHTQCIVSANMAFASERGYTPAEMVGMSADALYPADLVTERQAMRKVIDAGKCLALETEQITRDGRRFPVQLDCSVLRDDDGQTGYVIVYARDISDRKECERELQLAAAAFETQRAMIVFDAQRRIQRVNLAFTAMTGYEPQEAVGKDYRLLHSTEHDAAFYERHWQYLERHGCLQVEQWVQIKGGVIKLARYALSAIRDAGGAVIGYVGSLTDLTAEREMRARLDRVTFFDPLTSLPNRNFLRGQLFHF